MLFKYGRNTRQMAKIHLVERIAKKMGLDANSTMQNLVYSDWLKDIDVLLKRIFSKEITNPDIIQYVLIEADTTMKGALQEYLKAQKEKK
jgi:sialic acid synthase SpsE